METFERAAFLLNDYADMLDDMHGSAPDEPLLHELCSECRQVATRLLELNGEFEQKRAFNHPTQAAQIIAGMLDDWKLAGAVWYQPRIKRFRLVGEQYSPKPSEILCGTYLPATTWQMLAEDFEEVMRENPCPHSSPTTK